MGRRGQTLDGSSILGMTDAREATGASMVFLGPSA